MKEDAFSDPSLRIPQQNLPARPALPEALGWKDERRGASPTITRDEDDTADAPHLPWEDELLEEQEPIFEGEEAQALYEDEEPDLWADAGLDDGRQPA